MHKIKVNELQREIKSLESQVEDRGRGKHQTLSKQDIILDRDAAQIKGAELVSDTLLGKEMQLDRDLLIFQRALNNKVPDWPEGED